MKCILLVRISTEKQSFDYQEQELYKYKPKNKRIKWFIIDDNNEYPIDDIYGD